MHLPLMYLHALLFSFVLKKIKIPFTDSPFEKPS